MIFIPIKLKDLPTVLNLFKEAAERIHKMNIDHWQYWKNPPKEKIQWVKEGIKNKEFFFIEDTEGLLIGVVRILQEDLRYWGKQKEKASYIHSLVVQEKYNGKGMGTKIIHEIEKKAHYANTSYLRLDADAKNPKLCKYYENLGFEKAGIKELQLSTYQLYQKKIL
ncbi:GNAT family N-acetyltransferase [Mesonia aestuariivivens]|uniref:GNAT family N-acetyltransferase n=1 Tax=Mesonia aestuariivivens TaxID=2796128 RepID=A0ABS6W519_9FLAO|nr:GNAT family N-acetyltransferase [Mesonia aestuariivivens]MBW2962956.1 GNAT family N-acetyltransferase [Mesonia aestuariivivens]